MTTPVLELPRELTLSTASAALAELSSALAKALVATAPQALVPAAPASAASAVTSVAALEPAHAAHTERTHQTINIDARELAVLDTSALAVLMQCRRMAQEQGADVRLVDAPEKLDRLARLYGVQELIGSVP